MASPIGFKVFQKYDSQYRRASIRIDRASLSAMKRVGAIVRRAARKSIKRKTITAGMWSRLKAAQETGDKRRVARARATIERRSSQVSPVGSPPFSRSPDRPYQSIRDIRFHAQAKSVLIGPTFGGMRTQSWIELGTKTVPQVLEFGDVVLAHEESYDDGKTWHRRDMRRGTRSWKRYRTRRATYRPRPFMEPALRSRQTAIRDTIAETFRRRM